MPLWNEIEGRTLTDGSVLGTLLRSEGRIAWFSATDPEGRPAVVSIFEALNDEESVAARLETAARLQHPSLLALRGVATTRLEDEPMVHVVMEPFDQTLADVLRDRALTPDEAKDVAENLLSALEAVEHAGLRHGHVDAAGVLAVGDAIKLRSDCLSAAHGDSDAPALAALLYSALTKRRFTSERDAIQLPAPFASLVRAGAVNGGSLIAMRRVLTGPPLSSPGASSPAAAHPAAAARTAIPAATPTALAGAAATAARQPSTTSAPNPRSAVPAARSTGIPAVRQPRRPGIAIAAGVLMVILLIIFWLAFRRPAGHTPVSGQATIAAAPPATSNPAPAPNAAEQNAGAMGSASPAPAAALPARTLSSPVSRPVMPANAANGERAVWHVVAFTYDRQATAQNKATELAAKYPQLEPQVFSPNGRAPYLVVLGAGTDREAALARRNVARKAGMPRDTYAQNFRK